MVMIDSGANLQPLPVERAAGLSSSTAGNDGAAEPDSASLELEKSQLLLDCQGIVLEGMHS